MVGDNYEKDIKPAEELGVLAFQVSRGITLNNFLEQLLKLN